ncbi:hypothetical protein R3P38DRAFT_2778501 [Favolaschia claudopus]|uniref:Uncharacterized protein n=1 Tax=Favolaschia claudopus TaxID=2862362 RepID=A0AAW0BH91_9AGAR
MIAVISVVFLLFLGAVRALPLPDRVGVAMGIEANNAESAKVILGVGLILDDSSGRATTKPDVVICPHAERRLWGGVPDGPSDGGNKRALDALRDDGNGEDGE